MSADLNQEWENYKTKFNKKYKDEEEEQMRRRIYFNNKTKVEEHNVKFKAGEVSYSMALNAFSDNTPEEHARRSGGVISPR